MQVLVRHLASDLREHVVGVATDQSDRANHDNKDYGEHHGVFRYVLPALLRPKLADCLNHFCPQSTTHQAARHLSEQLFAVV